MRLFGRTVLCGDASVPASLLCENVGEGCDIGYSTGFDSRWDLNLRYRLYVTAHFAMCLDTEETSGNEYMIHDQILTRVFFQSKKP
jgi:hypothetical protein